MRDFGYMFLPNFKLFPVLSLQDWYPVWSSPGLSHILYGLMCYSVCLGYNDWLCELLSPSYQVEAVRPFLSDLWDQQGIFIHRNALTGCFLLFRPFSINTRDQPVWHQQSCHIQRYFLISLPHSDTYFELGPKALSCCLLIGWSNVCINEQFNKSTTFR